MNKLFYILTILFFIACKEKAKQGIEQVTSTGKPTKEVIDSLVKQWYDEIATRPGAASRSIDSVQVLNMDKETEQDTVYHIIFVASGLETNYSLPDPPVPLSFSDTGMIDLIWKGSYWDVLNKPNRSE